jgi:hypothetical protein
MKMRRKLAKATQQSSYSEDSSNIRSASQKKIFLYGARSVITVFKIVSRWSLPTEAMFC